MLFSDRSKFKLIQNVESTLTRLKTVQNYVKTMFNRNEIFEEDKKQLRPMVAQLGSAHGLPKTHKVYVYPHFDQLLTLPTLLIIILVNFYHPCCKH